MPSHRRSSMHNTHMLPKRVHYIAAGFSHFLFKSVVVSKSIEQEGIYFDGEQKRGVMIPQLKTDTIVYKKFLYCFTYTSYISLYDRETHLEEPNAAKLTTTTKKMNPVALHPSLSLDGCLYNFF